MKPTPISFFFIVLALPVFLGAGALWAQEQEEDKLFEVEQENEDDTLVQLFEWLRASPLDINRAAPTELQTLPWITPAMAQEIVKRRKKLPFTSINELLKLPGFDDELLHRLAPYLVCSINQEPSSFRLQTRQRISCKQQRSKGFVDSVFVGDRYKIYNRWRLDVQQLRLGLMTEKDAGEADLDDLRRAFIAYTLRPLKSEMILGHFSLESGQGLVFAPTFQIGRAYDPVLNGGRAAIGLRPGISAAETGGYYGFALRIHSEKSEGILFVSRNRWDAIVENDTVRSLPLSGLHRTIMENEHKNRLKVHSQGIILSHVFLNYLRVALAWRVDHFSHNFARGTEVKDRYDFCGRHNNVWGVQGDFFRGPLYIFSEWAHNQRQAVAYKMGLRWQAKGKSFLWSYHRFSPGFDDPRHRWSNVDQANESGLYGAVRWPIRPTLMLLAYSEYCRNPWPRYQQPMPDLSRVDHQIGIEWRPQKSVELLGRLRHRRQELAESFWDGLGNETKKIVAHGYWQVITQLDIIYPRVRLRTRWEFNLNHPQLDSPPWPRLADSRGLLFWQQLFLIPLSPLTITMRYGLFDAPDYSNRFYSFENDLPGVWRNKILYGRGLRCFLLLSFRLCRWLQAGCKWESIVYDDKTTYGSGWDQVNGKEENMLSLQLDGQWPPR